MKCPQCQSDNIQNARLVYESGTATMSGSARTGGLAYTPGIGSTYSSAVTDISGQQSSLTAQRYAPPFQKKTGCLWIGLLILCGFMTLVTLPMLVAIPATMRQQQSPEELAKELNWSVERARAAQGSSAPRSGFIGGLLFSCVVYAGGLTLLIRHKIAVNKYNREVWPPLYDAWTRNWLCHKCGRFGPI